LVVRARGEDGGGGGGKGGQGGGGRAGGGGGGSGAARTAPASFVVEFSFFMFFFGIWFCFVAFDVFFHFVVVCLLASCTASFYFLSCPLLLVCLRDIYMVLSVVSFFVFSLFLPGYICFFSFLVFF